MMKRYFMIMVIAIAVMFGFGFESHAGYSADATDVACMFDWDNMTQEEFEENLYLAIIHDHGEQHVYLELYDVRLFDGTYEEFEDWCDLMDQLF